MNYQMKFEEWLDRLEDTDPLKQELISIKDNETEKEERFYKDLSFGTAGLRGKVGAGTNRMNFYTVGKATQGIADYIIAHGEEAMKKGVVIAHDPRHFSKEFAELAAEIFAANGIKVYTFPSLRPTPELAFMVNRLGTKAGINITASHNPKEYNGYKVYWSDGAQISGAVSDGMLAEIQKLDFFDDFNTMPLPEAVEKGLVVMLGEELDREYLDYVKGMSQHPAEELDRNVSIVYTPLNGAGSDPVRIVMTEMGFTNFHIVPEQKDPDPEFTTVGYPNPEDPKGFELAEKLGHETQAQVLIATDPDCDRMAIEVLGEDGDYQFLNGNQTGAMLIAYMAQGLTESGKMPENPALIKSIVTGDMGAAIAEKYGIRVFQALTGFKNICGKIHDVKEAGCNYFFGYEESIGCAPGEAVRDKDGVCCAMLVAEMTAYYAKKGMTLKDALEELYKTYGYFSEDQVSLVRKGAEGAALIGRIMDAFRDGKPQTFGPFTVQKTTDYINGYEDIPASNVLRFDLEKGTWFAMRPSGTEPKIKFYFYSVADNKEESAEKVEEMKKAVDELVSKVK